MASRSVSEIGGNAALYQENNGLLTHFFLKSSRYNRVSTAKVRTRMTTAMREPAPVIKYSNSSTPPAMAAVRRLAR